MHDRKTLLHRSILALAVAAAAACLGGPPARSAHAQSASTTAAGFNVAWIKGKYGQDLTSGFDPADWQRVFQRANAAGATVVRVWILEGAPMQGVLWSASDPHYPSGVDPALLQNIQTVAAIASDNSVQIYWTAVDSNVPSDTKPGLERDRFWNIYNDDYGMGEAWRQNVLGPVLDAIATRPDVAFGLDVLNEVEGSLSREFFRDDWAGARRFISQTVAFAHARAPGLKVSSSAGWDNASGDILEDRFDGLGLDFLDVHAYTDFGFVPSGNELADYAWQHGTTLVLGEFGQLKKSEDPAHQASLVRGILADARRLGFVAAMPWRLEDEDPRYSFFDAQDQPKPAYGEVKAFTGK